MPWNEFKQEDWAYNKPITKATQEAKGVLIELRNHEHKDTINAEVAIYQIGWLRTCGGN